MDMATFVHIYTRSMVLVLRVVESLIIKENLCLRARVDKLRVNNLKLTIK